jgi:hypothetical protein
MLLERHHHSLAAAFGMDFHDLDVTSDMLNSPVSTSKNIAAQAPAGPAPAPASGAKVAASNATASAPATPASTTPASETPAANSTIGTGAGAANGTVPASLGNSSNSTNATTTTDGGDADEIAAESDAEKAAMLTRYAKQKVNDLVTNLKALDTHVKDQFAALESILNNVEINAEFDPESAEDIAWITTEITKILEDTPEIAALEDKLGMVKDTDPVLKTVISNLKKVTNITTMQDLKAKNAADYLPSGLPKKNKSNASVNASNSTNATSANATTPAAAPATAPAAAPAADAAAAPAEVAPAAAESAQLKAKKVAVVPNKNV